LLKLQYTHPRETSLVKRLGLRDRTEGREEAASCPRKQLELDGTVQIYEVLVVGRRLKKTFASINYVKMHYG
jgi:hypothetical protein